MSAITAINPADLLVDEENPRNEQPNAGQRNAARSLAAEVKRKLQVLAEDIVTHGINPSDLLIVMKAPQESGRYIVLEGNRRLVAIRALENPEMFSGAVTSPILTNLRKLSKEYQKNPVDSISCVVMDREEASHWINLRHTGENEGAGIVPWDSQQVSRFKARTKGIKQDYSQQVLDFLESEGGIDSKERKKIPATSFKRLVESPVVREKLGIDLQEGELKLLADRKAIVKALAYIVDDLVSKRVKVGDIYNKDQREKYANKIPKKIAVKSTIEKGKGIQANTNIVSEPKRARRTKTPTSRDHLIPSDCVLEFRNQRLRNIEDELRILSLEKHTNAVSVMLRVFVELGVDDYVEHNGISTDEREPLSGKISKVLKDLQSKKKLNKDQAAPVRTAIQKGSPLAATISTFNSYVHNPYQVPLPSDLRASWDSLQPFMTAISRP